MRIKGTWVLKYLSSVEGRAKEQEGREMSTPVMITITEQFHQKLSINGETRAQAQTHTHTPVALETTAAV